MKLIRQSKLELQEGNSDKVYEVDLCKAGEGDFLVNFRYGRRGSNLRDGTKTVFPVSLTQAESIFDKLVSEKTRKGYRVSEESGLATTPPEAESSPTQVFDDPRRVVVQQR